jgi:hypothetical protein
VWAKDTLALPAPAPASRRERVVAAE